MSKLLWIIVGILLSISVIIFGVILYFLGALISSSNYYRAAVLEIVPYRNSSQSIEEVVWMNLQTYTHAVGIASENGVDIIVFPENTLFEPGNKKSPLIGSIAEDIPDPKLGDFNPCAEEDLFKNQPILRNLSCLAKFGEMYVVANMIDYKKIDNDKSIFFELNFLKDIDSKNDNFYLFNANVVFNRDGRLIAKYHKKHVFLEASINPSKSLDYGYFETDFGKFITTTCIDLFSKEPIEAVNKTHAQNVAYPTCRHNFTTGFFSNSFQQAFALTNNVNLLAAHGHVHSTVSLGSGIFSGSNGPLISTYSDDNRTKLLISNVPKYPGIHNIDIDLKRKLYVLKDRTYTEEDVRENDQLKHDNKNDLETSSIEHYESLKYFLSNITDYTSKRLEKNEGTLKLCSHSLCCSLVYKAVSMDEDYFFIVADAQSNFFNFALYAVEACFMVRCKSDDGKICDYFYPRSSTVFKGVQLKGTFSSKYVYPDAVDDNNRLTNIEELTFDGKTEIKYRNLLNNSLLHFGLTGRKYEKDKPT